MKNKIFFMMLIFILVITLFVTARVVDWNSGLTPYFDNFANNISIPDFWGIEGTGTVTNLNHTEGYTAFFLNAGTGSRYKNWIANGSFRPVDSFNSENLALEFSILSYEASGGDETGTHYLRVFDESGNNVSVYSASGDFNTGEDETINKTIDLYFYPSLDFVNRTIDGGSETEVNVSTLNDGENWFIDIGLEESNANVEINAWYMKYALGVGTPIVNSPANNSAFLSDSIEFNVSMLFFQNMSNSTFTIYNSTSIFNQTTISVTGYNNESFLTISNFDDGNYKWNVETCDLEGCISLPENYTFIYGIDVENFGFVTPVYETSNQQYNITFNLSTSTTPTVNLILNGTSYSTTTSNINGNQWFSTVNANVPLGNTTISHFWNIVAGTLNGNTINNNQSINLINLTECSAAPQNIGYYNFTLLDEFTFNEINGSVESVLTYWLGDGSVNKSFLFSSIEQNLSKFDFCFTPSDQTLYLSGLNNYYATGYDARSYYFTNTSKNSASGNIDLYLLSTASSDVVVFTVVDSFLTPVSNAEIRILRWNLITDTFFLVNTIFTGSGGQASSNLRLNDAYYVFVVSVDGVTYLTTNPEILFSATKTLQIDLTTTSTIYDTFKAVDYSLTFDNSTNIIEFIYNDGSNTIGGGCLMVSQLQATGSIILSNVCEESPTGVLDYTLTQNGTYTARGYVFANQPSGQLTYTLATLDITLGLGERFATIGKAAQAISLIFIGTMAMLGVAVGSIAWGLVLIIVSFIILNLLGFVNFTAGFITLIISIIIMIALSLQRKFG